MGYVMGYGPCFSCGNPFSFNPRRVPSFKGEPICRDCIALVNAKRKAAGSPLWPVHDDAYEALPEEAL